MKLRLRSLDSKQTVKLQVPTPCTLQNLKQILSQSIPSSSSSSLHLSLNNKDELQASSPQASLQSLAITSGDLIFFTHNPTAFSSQTLTLIPNSETPLIGDLSVHDHDNSDSDVDMSDEETLGGGGSSFSGSGSETMEVDDGSVFSGKKPFEGCFLRRVLRMELGGSDGGDHRLMVIAIHAVLLESGLVGLDSVTGMRVDRFHLPDVWPSKFFTMSLWYTLPELVGGKGFTFNVAESIVLKFQSVGQYVKVSGSLEKGGSGLYNVCLNENRFVPALELVWGESNNEDGYPETEVLEFWKIVKDGLVLPLLIDLCEKTGLTLPPCFMGLPTELKLKIFESLSGVDLAKVGCVCSDLRDLSSSSELWKKKFDQEFGPETGGAQGLNHWKAEFKSSWDRKKKRKRVARAIRSHPFPFGLRLPVIRDPHPFVLPHYIGGNHAPMPSFTFPENSLIRQSGRFRRTTPYCSLGGGADA